MCYNKNMKIITSNTSRGAYNGVIAQLKRNLDGENVVIAPDRYTASVEKGLLTSLHIDGTVNVNVMSFTRLANRLLGKDVKKCLTPEGSVMLIGKVINDCKDKLNYYGKVANAEGFANELYAALTAIRNSGITSTQLLANKDKMSPSLKAKAEDISMIYEGYLSALEGKHSDSSTRLYTLAQYILDNPQSVATTHFYCTDIYDFSHPEFEILKGLAKNALSLTIGVPSGYDNPNKRIYPDRLISQLKGIAEGRVEIERADEQLSPAINAISTKLFAYISTDADSIAPSGGKVALRVAKDRHDEVMALAMDVSRSVRDGGRYRDFEVYASDLDAYKNELKSVFSRYNIPFFIDRKELLSEQAKVRYVLDAIACAQGGFKMRDVFNFVKNPLFIRKLDGGDDAVFLFENYCLKYNIEYSRFHSPFTIVETSKYRNSQNNGFTYDKTADKVSKLTFEKENAIPEYVRERLIETLSPLKNKTLNIKEHVQSVRTLLSHIDEAWATYVDELSGISGYFRKCAEQVDGKLSSVLDEIDGVLDVQIDFSGFAGIFSSMIKTLKIALVPTYLDCVFIGDDDSRFSGEKHLHVLGANNGSIPKVSTGGAVISSRDEKALHGMGVEITPNEKQKSLASMYFVLDLLKKPQGKLTVSYCEGGEGGAMRPSTVIYELSNMLHENGKPLEVERIDFDGLQGESFADVFATEKSCYYETLRNFVSGRAVAEQRSAYASAYGFIDHEDKKRIDKIYSVPERIDLPANAYFKESTSVSRLETFYRCPYQHYFNYVLSLKKRKDGKFEGTENGTVLHYILEKFFTDLRDGKIDEEHIAERAYGYFDGAIKENGFERLLEKPDTGRLLLRVRDEGVDICRDLYKARLHSKFTPTMLEAKIGGGQIQPMALDFGDKQVQLRGTVDRVDLYGDKFLVIDYKTYKSADLTFKELYYGEKIQLYVYMRAIEKSIDAKPCGVFYLPIFAGFTGEDSSRYKYKGQTSDSIEVLQSIDDRVIENSAQSLAPYSLNRKKDGLNEKVHMSHDDMDKLGDYAVAIASKGAEEISKGYVKPVPIKDKCDLCAYADICAYKGLYERKLCTVGSLLAFDLTKEESND